MSLYYVHTWSSSLGLDMVASMTAGLDISMTLPWQYFKTASFSSYSSSYMLKSDNKIASSLKIMSIQYSLIYITYNMGRSVHTFKFLSVFVVDLALLVELGYNDETGG